VFLAEGMPKLEGGKKLLNAVTISPAATETWNRTMEHYSRILVLGPTGWFGRTALELSFPSSAALHLVGSFQRDVRVGEKTLTVHEWDERQVERFSPDIVLDFAYLTRSWISEMGLAEYRARNEILAERLEWAARLRSVRTVVTISSGAAVQPELDPYGEGKRNIEFALTAASKSSSTNLGVLRAWSVSGGFVRNPNQYALSSFVKQGLDSGTIQVSADRMVYRRYCAVEELLAVGLHLAHRHSHTLLESGGEKLEMFEVAQKVAEQIQGAKVVLEHPNRDSRDSDDYSSDNESWIAGIREAQLIPMTIEQQITNVIHALRRR